MLETKWLYLALNIFTISVPLIRSFESRIAYYKSFDSLFKSIAIVGAFFIIWDIWFTHTGVWGFNPKYLSGIDIVNLPLEEWLFFITVPFSCVFIYRVLNYFIKKDPLARYHLRLTHFFFAFSLVMAVMHTDQMYTFVNFILLAAYLGWEGYYKKSPWMGRFYLAYAVAIIPFFIVNGILTGTGIEEQVVWYNDEQNMGIRMGTIPVEDTFYGMLLILMNIGFYEYFESRKKLKA